MEGPVDHTSPHTNNALDYLKLLWPTEICAMLADQTNRYAVQNRVQCLQRTTATEIWLFLGTILVSDSFQCDVVTRQEFIRMHSSACIHNLHFYTIIPVCNSIEK